MKYVFLTFLFFTLSLYSQNTIKGKLITSESFKEQFPVMLVSVDGFSEKSPIDKKGLFELPIEKQQTEYLLNFFINDSLVKKYTYKNEWSRRKRPKSISLSGTCFVTNKTASQDWKNKNAKLYVLQQNKLSPHHIKLQKKYGFSYLLINKNNYINYDCFITYNHRIIKNLILSKDIFFKDLNQNIVGLNKFNIGDKSIVLNDKCTINKESAITDWERNEIKLYLFKQDELSRKDNKTQQKYNFNYVLVHKKDYINYDCYKNYNIRALKYLVLSKELSIKKLNTNTIGISKFSLKDKPCIQ